MTAPAPADDPDRHERDRVRRRQKRHQRFGFHFKVFRLERQCRPSCQVDEPETALRVGQGTARTPGELAAHPAIHLPAQPGNGARVGHPVPDNQQRPGLPGALKKSRHVIRRMLAVTVQREDPCKILLSRLGQAGPERDAFAEVFCVPDHLRARRLRPGRRVVRRTIIHDQYPGKLLARRGDQGRNARPFVETGDHHRACRRSRHASSLNKISGAIEAKPAHISTRPLPRRSAAKTGRPRSRFDVECGCPPRRTAFPLLRCHMPYIFRWLEPCDLTSKLVTCLAETQI